VAVLIPRMRTLGVRLNEEEFSSLEKFCLESGARSMSDVVRNAIFSFVRRGNEESALASTVNQNVAQVKELEEKIARLSAEIALLRAAATPGSGPAEGGPPIHQ